MSKETKQETSERGIGIETGVALPAGTSFGGRKYPFPELAKGEPGKASFFVPRPPPEKSDPHGALYAGAKRAGIRITIRERKPENGDVNEHGEPEDGFRVWLVEKLAK